MATSMSDRLAKLGSEFESTETKGGGFTTPDDGKYIFNVDSSVVTEHPKTKNLQIQYVFSIVEGAEEFIGKKVYDWDNLQSTENNPDTVGYTKGRLEMFGIEMDEFDINDLPDALESLVGVRFEGTLKTKGGFQNIYCNELIDM